MIQYETQLEDLEKKAISKSYEPKAHRNEDSKRDSIIYVPKTLKNQNGVLKRYKKQLHEKEISLIHL